MAEAPRYTLVQHALSIDTYVDHTPPCVCKCFVRLTLCIGLSAIVLWELWCNGTLVSLPFGSYTLMWRPVYCAGPIQGFKPKG